MFNYIQNSTPLLDQLELDLVYIKQLDYRLLNQLCNELRIEVIKLVSSVGGHLGAGLGVIELTIALHYVFSTPDDLLVWDIGHQCYPHKILTGRRSLMHTLRSPYGISGFTKRTESKFDCFGAGHSSTSISAALGMAAAKSLINDKQHEVIAIIGDGALSAGMAYEAINNANLINKRIIVILNDNQMSIAPAVGAVSKHLEDINNKSNIDYLLSIINNYNSPKKAQFDSEQNIFTNLGFFYIGVVDGHNIENLVDVFCAVKQNQAINQPILIHIITEKGKGFNSTEYCKEKFHAVSKFNIKDGIQQRKNINSYTKVFSECITNEAKINDKIIAITAAMPSGTGLESFAKQFPDRFFDVGIAEQHAVTFAAGLACESFIPVVAIYSTFLQRAYDQIIHDVAIQNLAVRFIIDRAGFVGADGPTHAGSFDLTYLATLPNFIIMAPSDEVELQSMIKTSLSINNAPSAIRYPRAEAIKLSNSFVEILPIGKAKIIKKGQNIAIISVGTRLQEVIKADKVLITMGIDITIVDARFIKPIDKKLITQLVENHKLIITIEENSIGGFGAQVNNYLLNELMIDNIKIRNLFISDSFVEQNTIEEMYDQIGLNSQGIINFIIRCLKNN